MDFDGFFGGFWIQKKGASRIEVKQLPGCRAVVDDNAGKKAGNPIGLDKKGSEVFVFLM